MANPIAASPVSPAVPQGLEPRQQNGVHVVFYADGNCGGRSYPFGVLGRTWWLRDHDMERERLQRVVCECVEQWMHHGFICVGPDRLPECRGGRMAGTFPE
ncbi:hypothetical protein GGTG_14372 [Gaeumannomyces tritici R3-111a-1]|uniref:Uncharacterized protein n=1 Tax=Gaeumannomyces tritici (strain R3-111a-1) TaxID=644352 RepID=J3PLB4_GAET3|nr:hypothetical protein GGTG_14372 [Gaeumannomyces tritici R3-111a-1]EJT68049.1 hypothetical protein GGTG_14372 [Gaeumannomyces tritici R3-111a-1]